MVNGISKNVLECYKECLIKDEAVQSLEIIVVEPREKIVLRKVTVKMLENILNINAMTKYTNRFF